MSAEFRLNMVVFSRYSREFYCKTWFKKREPVTPNFPFRFGPFPFPFFPLKNGTDSRSVKKTGNHCLEYLVDTINLKEYALVFKGRQKLSVVFWIVFFKILCVVSR